MQESTLFKISLALSIIGILILLFLTEINSEELITIEEALNSSVDTKVKIRGEITSLAETPGILLLSLKENLSEIKAIAFKEEEINLNKKDYVEVTGIIKEYKNEKEIEVESISLL